MTKEKELLDLMLLNIGYAVHHADWNYKNVNSPFARIYLIKEGKARLHLPTHVQELSPGHLYMIPPFTLHSYECNNHFALYYMHIYENPLSNNRILEDFIFPEELNAEHLDVLLINRLYEINPGRELKEYDPSDYDNSSTLMQNIHLHINNPIYNQLETKGILFQLLSRFLALASDKYKITDNRIQDTLRYIRNNIDRNISIKELSDTCHLSKDHFIRLFKKEIKMTPTQYINRKKIEKSQLMILTKNCSIKDIAYNLSFDNISYFNRLFKKYTGITPLEYRHKLK